mgnify:CR=1 FL=1|jgi:hypothetical protein
MKKPIILILAATLLSLTATARQPHRGYRGFFEWSNSLRSENFAYVDMSGNLYFYRESTFYTGFSTSHGYQINPKFFIGAGLGMEGCTNDNIDNWVVPVFIQSRIDLQFGKFTPFGDLKLGANLSEGIGAYISPTIGYRFNWGRKMSVNAGMGLTLAGYRVEHFEGTWTGPDSYELQYIGTKHHIRPYFSFRIGIDF